MNPNEIQEQDEAEYEYWHNGPGAEMDKVWREFEIACAKAIESCRMVREKLKNLKVEKL